VYFLFIASKVTKTSSFAQCAVAILGYVMIVVSFNWFEVVGSRDPGCDFFICVLLYGCVPDYE